MGAPSSYRPDEGIVQVGVQIAAGAMPGVDVRSNMPYVVMPVLRVLVRKGRRFVLQSAQGLLVAGTIVFHLFVLALILRTHARRLQFLAQIKQTCMSAIVQAERDDTYPFQNGVPCCRRENLTTPRRRWLANLTACCWRAPPLLRPATVATRAQPTQYLTHSQQLPLQVLRRSRRDSIMRHWAS